MGWLDGPGKPKAKKGPMKPNRNVPKHWTGDLSVTSKQQTPQGVHDAVQKLMDGTWKNIITRDRYTCGTGDKEIMKYEVVQVLRNQNPAVWETYDRKRAAIKSSMRGKSTKTFKTMTSDYLKGFKTAEIREPFNIDNNEVMLFHGTKPAAADAICDTQFRPSGPDALFGPGVYFAESSSKSDEYVQDEQDGIYLGLFATLLCRVTLGKVLYNDQTTPDKSMLTSKCSKGAFHSVIGDREKVRGTYREFIVYDVKQAYPEYIVIYRRVPDKRGVNNSNNRKRR